MELSQDVITGLSAGGGAWALKELFSFLLKWKKTKSGSQFYKPSAEWEEFCKTEFKDIRETLHKIDKAQEVLSRDHEIRISRLEKQEERGGYDNGRY